jgi:uncharacterized membrane protein
LGLWVLLLPVVHLGPLVAAGEWRGAFPVVAVCTAAAGLLTAMFYRTRHLEQAAGWVRGKAPWLLAVACVLYFEWSLVRASAEYRAFSPHMSQLGLFAQSAWTTLHGHAFANTHETVDGSLGSHFGVHFSPTLLLLTVPLYAVWPSPMALLVLQAVFAALAPVVLYLLLRRREVAAEGAWLLAAAMFLLPAYSRAGWNDFHDVVFLPVFLLAVMWAVHAERRIALWVLAVLALGVREDAGMTLAAIGVYVWCARRDRWTAMGLAALGLGWFLIAVALVMPRFRSEGLWMDPSRFFILHMGWWADSPWEAIGRFFREPGAFFATVCDTERLRYLYELFRPTLLLPVTGSLAWVPALPTLAASLLSEHYWMRNVVKYHVLVPLTFAFTATVFTAGTLSRVDQRRRGTALLLGLVVLLGVLPAWVFSEDGVRGTGPPVAASRTVVAVIPEDAAVYVPVGLYAALSNRSNVGCWENLGEASIEAIDRGDFGWVVLWPRGDAPGAGRHALLATLLTGDARYERIEEQAFGPLLVYRKRRAD